MGGEGHSWVASISKLCSHALAKLAYLRACVVNLQTTRCPCVSTLAKAEMEIGVMGKKAVIEVDAPA